MQVENQQQQSKMYQQVLQPVDEASTKQQPPKKKSRVSIACCHCQKAHVSCDTARPCKRCVDRGLGDTCVDGKVQKRGRKGVTYSVDYYNDQAWKNNSIFEFDDSLLFNKQQILNSFNMQNNNNLKSQQASIKQSASYSVEDLISDAALSLDSPLMALLRDETQIIDLPQTSSNEMTTFTEEEIQQLLVTDPTDLSFFQNVAPFPLQPTFSSTYAPPPTNNKNKSKNPFSKSSINTKLIDVVTPQQQPQQIMTNNIKQQQSSQETVNNNNKSSVDYADRLMQVMREKVSDPEMDRWTSMNDIMKEVDPHQQAFKETAEANNHFFSMYLNLFRSTFEEIATPTLIWDRSGSIHYINPCFVQLTGFSLNLPTDPDSFALVRTFSRGALRKILKAMNTNFMDVNFNSMMIHGGILLWRQAETETYVKGTMSITLKRNLVGMPLLFVCNFLPDKQNL